MARSGGERGKEQEEQMVKRERARESEIERGKGLEGKSGELFQFLGLRWLEGQVTARSGSVRPWEGGAQP
jgi:hypothetical protein